MNFFFFFNDTATPDIYTLSLHDALPICPRQRHRAGDDARHRHRLDLLVGRPTRRSRDRKSTRLNSSHLGISYAVFCLKKKKKKIKLQLPLPNHDTSDSHTARTTTARKRQ